MAHLREASGPSSKPILPGLDGLRAIAILMVIAYHLGTTWAQRSHHDPSRFEPGRHGVMIFFALSGYLITHLLLRGEARDGRIDLKTFFNRRFWRIVPAAWCYLLFATLFAATGLSSTKPRQIVAAGLGYWNLAGPEFVPDLSHFWTLALEMQFYLVWPILLILVRSNGIRLGLTAALLILGPFWRYFNLKMFGTGGSLQRLDLVSDGFLAGGLMALLEVSRIAERWRPAAVRWRHLITGAAVLGMIVSFFGLIPGKLGGFAGLSVGAFSSAVLVIQVANGRAGWLNPLLDLALLRLIGIWSYSLYLWQQPFCQYTAALESPWPVALIATFGTAIASYYLVERGISHVKSRAVAFGQ